MRIITIQLQQPMKIILNRLLLPRNNRPTILQFLNIQINFQYLIPKLYMINRTRIQQLLKLYNLHIKL